MAAMDVFWLNQSITFLPVRQPLSVVSLVTPGMDWHIDVDQDVADLDPGQ